MTTTTVLIYCASSDSPFPSAGGAWTYDNAGGSMGFSFIGYTAELWRVYTGLGNSALYTGYLQLNALWTDFGVPAGHQIDSVNFDIGYYQARGNWGSQIGCGTYAKLYDTSGANLIGSFSALTAVIFDSGGHTVSGTPITSPIDPVTGIVYLSSANVKFRHYFAMRNADVCDPATLSLPRKTNSVPGGTITIVSSVSGGGGAAVTGSQIINI